MKKFLFDCGTRDSTASLGILFLRVCTGLMMFFGHGLGKIQGFAKAKDGFPVPDFLLNRLPGGMGSLFLDSQRVEPVVLQSFDFEWSFPDLESALRDIERKS